MDRDYEKAIKVDSVAQEYLYVARQGCSCGGRLRPTGQALLEYKGRRYDLLKTQCQACGSHGEFLFDINSFFGRR
jgi:hypothetical protein